jgi:protein-L-isoaspartate(D-aspartate) O-methyltransferase
VTVGVVGPRSVSTVGCDPEPARRTRRTLEQTEYGEVSVRTGDGHDGWAEHAPYDAVYVTCATDSLQNPIGEVHNGGRLLTPLGRHRQTLTHAEKGEGGRLRRESVCSVWFVRMRGGE